MNFWISDWISGFHCGFLDFWISQWISQWISGFQFGFLPTVYKISFVTDPSGQRAYEFCTSLVPKSMTVVIGLGTRLDVRMRTRLKNAVLRNRQQPGSAENRFDYSKFEAMKSLSDWDAARCNEHQFRAKIKVST